MRGRVRGALQRGVRARESLHIVQVHVARDPLADKLVDRTSKFPRKRIIGRADLAGEITAIDKRGAAGPGTEQCLWQRVG